MDFRSEIEQHDRKMRIKIEKQLDEIHQLQERILTFDDKITRLQTKVDEFNQKNAPQLKILNEKKELITQWEMALDEHKYQLLANQTLISLEQDMILNQDNINEQLLRLEKEETAIQKRIAEFDQEHYISSDVESRLHRELEEQQTALTQVMEKITYFTNLREQLNIFIKMFLNLLESFGWRTNPVSNEYAKLIQISENISEMTQNLSEYNKNQQQLETLRHEEENIQSEKKHLLLDKASLEQIEKTQKAISESQSTIKQLTSQIQVGKTACDELQKKISSKQLDKLMKEQRDLEHQKTAYIAAVKEKSLQLSQIDNPERTALKIALKDELLQIITHHERYIQDQEVFKRTHSVRIFKPESEKNSLPNFLALTKLQHAIKKYQKGLDKSGSEYQLLTQVINKLLLWQIAEDTTNANLSFAARLVAHTTLVDEIGTLVKELPIDNPLHVATTYMSQLTAPVENTAKANASIKKNIPGAA